MPDPADVDERLQRHLRSWLGAWPPQRPVHVVGVGRKQHDAHGHELAVVTEEPHRGQGLAQRLVTQAARQVLADGAVPVYLHAEDNVASARTADASGFADVGWRILGLFGGAAGNP